jgi:dihydrofolate reductase
MITVIASMCEGGGLGLQGRLAWNLPEELNYFRQTTTDNIVVVGRATWDSLKVRPLPNRHNIVISKTLRELNGADVCRSIEDAILLAQKTAAGREVFVIGGASIYEQILRHRFFRVDRLLLSLIPGSYCVDKWFPKIAWGDWSLYKKRDFTTFVAYDFRRKDSSVFSSTE